MANRIINNHSNNDADRRNRLTTSLSSTRYNPEAASGTNLKNNLSVDDVIVSLSNAYENRRARQATEWERVGRQNIPLVL
jgi:hypothetical protein